MNTHPCLSDAVNMLCHWTENLWTSKIATMEHVAWAIKSWSEIYVVEKWHSGDYHVFRTNDQGFPWIEIHRCENFEEVQFAFRRRVADAA